MVVLVVTRDVGTTAVELVVEELVVELELVVVWAPAPPPVNSPKATTSASGPARKSL